MENDEPDEERNLFKHQRQINNASRRVLRKPLDDEDSGFREDAVRILEEDGEEIDW